MVRVLDSKSLKPKAVFEMADLEPDIFSIVRTGKGNIFIIARNGTGYVLDPINLKIEQKRKIDDLSLSFMNSSLRTQKGDIVVASSHSQGNDIRLIDPTSLEVKAIRELYAYPHHLTLTKEGDIVVSVAFGIPSDSKHTQGEGVGVRRVIEVLDPTDLTKKGETGQTFYYGLDNSDSAFFQSFPVSTKRGLNIFTASHNSVYSAELSKIKATESQVVEVDCPSVPAGSGGSKSNSTSGTTR